MVFITKVTAPPPPTVPCPPLQVPPRKQRRSNNLQGVRRAVLCWLGRSARWQCSKPGIASQTFMQCDRKLIQRNLHNPTTANLKPSRQESTQPTLTKRPSKKSPGASRTISSVSFCKPFASAARSASEAKSALAPNLPRGLLLGGHGPAGVQQLAVWAGNSREHRAKMSKGTWCRWTYGGPPTTHDAATAAEVSLPTRAPFGACGCSLRSGCHFRSHLPKENQNNALSRQTSFMDMRAMRPLRAMRPCDCQLGPRRLRRPEPEPDGLLQRQLAAFEELRQPGQKHWGWLRKGQTAKTRESGTWGSILHALLEANPSRVQKFITVLTTSTYSK